MKPVHFLVCASLALAQSPTPLFRADVNLQSIAVQVTDKEGRDVRGLAAADFTILEDGHPQQIAFFGADDQPISLVILLDSSSSMESSRKLAGALTLLGPLLRGNRPEDEVFLAPFTDRVGAFQRLSADQRVSPPAVIVPSPAGGTALYDALAAGLCDLRAARNLRQAVAVITDGSDQHAAGPVMGQSHIARRGLAVTRRPGTLAGHQALAGSKRQWLWRRLTGCFPTGPDSAGAETTNPAEAFASAGPRRSNLTLY